MTENGKSVVRFLVDGVVIDEQIVFDGESAVAPPKPTKENHKFKGWDRKFKNISENVDIHAKFKANNEGGLYNLLKGIIVENPLFVSLLGTCPALATTTSVESALGMGVLFMFVLIGSNIVISLIRKITPPEVKIPVYIVVIATFVTIVKMLAQAFVPELYSSLGVFISLIVVNCIVLGRAEAFASKNKVFDSFLDAIGMGIGYTMAIVLVAIIREFFGTGGFTFGVTLTFIPFVQFLPLKAYAMQIFVMSPGAFLVLGIILAIIASIKIKKEDVIKFNEKQAKIAKMKEAIKEGDKK